MADVAGQAYNEETGIFGHNTMTIKLLQNQNLYAEETRKTSTTWSNFWVCLKMGYPPGIVNREYDDNPLELWVLGRYLHFRTPYYNTILRKPAEGLG